MKTLITKTIHTALDYGLSAWLPFEPPHYFIKELMTIENTSIRAALGALPTTPTIFLTHDADLTPTKIRLQSKIMNFMATALTKLSHSPVHNFVKQAQNSNPKFNHTPFHCFFQHPVSKEIAEHIQQIPLGPSDILTRHTNYLKVIQDNKQMAKADANSLSATLEHVIILTDGSRILKGTTAAATWCKNTNRSDSEHLGPARTHGI